MTANGGRMTPVLKWAGGKTQLLKTICSGMPGHFNRYFEPFVGSGAVLLHLRPAAIKTQMMTRG
ncbi:MAG: DNA adenine methylase [Fretibacterium sp.]|nr:DNA adenine methylase [Fretibacterium sp.]